MLVRAVLLVSVLGLFWLSRRQGITIWQGVWLVWIILLGEMLGTLLVRRFLPENLMLYWYSCLGIMFSIIGLGLSYVAVIVLYGGWVNRHIRAYRSVNLTILSQAVLLLTIPLLFELSRIWPKLYVLTQCLVIMVLYFVFWWFAFSCGFWCYRQQQRQLPDDVKYILVLGALLRRDGGLSSVLKQRLDCALDLGEKLPEAPYYILSGGKTGQTVVTEASVMCTYVLTKGVSDENIVQEPAARNTFENFKKSKQILQRLSLKTSSGVFVTNDYHAYRAALLAQQIGMTTVSVTVKSDRVQFWYGYMREFFSIMFSKRWWHLSAIMLLCGLFLFVG